MTSREVIREVVAEGLTRPIPPVVSRDVAIPHLAERASVIKGVRRSGKTFRMFQRMGELVLEGVPRDHMLFVDFEDDRLDGVSDNVIGDVVEEFLRALWTALPEQLYLFFDEVQNVEGWGRPLRRLTQDPRFEICVSGSSEKMLSEGVATEFRGRGISAELQPFSFREFLRFRAREPKGIVSPDEAREFSLLFEQYLRVGGFPEVQDADVATRITALQDIVWTIAARDLAERHGLPMLGTRKFVQRALRLSGREFSVRKTYNDLHSAQIPLSKADAFSLPEHCQDAYLFLYPDLARTLLRPPEERGSSTRLTQGCSLPLVRPPLQMRGSGLRMPSTWSLGDAAWETGGPASGSIAQKRALRSTLPWETSRSGRCRSCIRCPRMPRRRPRLRARSGL